VWEHVVSAVYVYPFRCQLCATRFSRFQFRRYARHSQDRREYDRLTVRVPVTLVSRTGLVEGETVDLSLNGCSVRASGPVAAGSTVQVRLRLGQTGDVTVAAAAVRTQHQGVLGLQFETMTAGERDRLSRYLGRFLRPTGTGRRRSGLPSPEVVLAAAIGLIVIIMVFMLIGRVGGPPLR
jgi:hypothetical protein